MNDSHIENRKEADQTSTRNKHTYKTKSYQHEAYHKLQKEH
jgi:hypothetical protein